MKKSDADARDLVREIHHRVKNNLQIIASILRLQMRREDSPAAQNALAGAIHRILGMVQVHDLLSRADESVIDLRELLGRLVDLNIQTFLLPGQVIRHQVIGDPSPIPAEAALNVAVAANELIVNSLKHAFPGKKEGRIDVTLAREAGSLRIEIRDDGAGLPENFTLTGSPQLGLRLVRSILGDDLKGSFELISDHGTLARLTLPLSPVS